MKISQTPPGAISAHRVHAAVPRVEVADDAHAIGVRGPDGEVRAGRRPDGDPVRAELFERMQMRPSPSRWMSKSVRTRPYRYGSSTSTT